MAAKSDKEKTPKKAATKAGAAIKKIVAKPKEQLEDDIDDIETDDEKPSKGKKMAAVKGKSDEEGDDDSDVDEVEDTWNKPEDGDDWDPDFDEFDLPKSSAKKTGTTKKSAKDDDDDFKIDDEFKDLFDNKSSKFDDDDDDY
jgi:DNA-directed RNA polymerase subunit delta